MHDVIGGLRVKAGASLTLDAHRHHVLRNAEIFGPHDYIRHARHASELRAPQSATPRATPLDMGSGGGSFTHGWDPPAAREA